MAIFNDDRQQMVWVWQKLFYNNNFISTDNHNPDFCKLAEAYNIPSLICDNSQDLPGIIEKFLTFEGPILADFRVVPDICLPMVVPGKALDEMFLLEDREHIFGIILLFFQNHNFFISTKIRFGLQNSAQQRWRSPRNFDKKFE